ncbi:N-acetyltransferase GCN5 [Fimicolochytrium jonesii]|uniref:N-acetyltransferase GCN5 n=1 Tax=Fimicolochytrium jonesii TaxID=1396493 RepID=UPI0022FEBEE2|nr:N-acetyltransferase GCN5 [Fimicolochytrium jonesii]KAI8821373.1 N-acetyltransferase GCN5 [Fimicolochytrium jonesii]
MTNITIVEESPTTADARALIDELEEHLASLYPAENRYGANVHTLVKDGVKFFVIRVDEQAAGCVGLKIFPDNEYGELKRMYVRPVYRGFGLGKKLLERVFEAAKENGVPIVRCETGTQQTEAIGLYQRAGFSYRGPFGPYLESEANGGALDCNVFLEKPL